MEIIKTPWKDRFMELIDSSENSIKMTSPFVKNNICEDIVRRTKENVKIELITSYKLINIYSGLLDLPGLEKILNNNGIIRNYARLHAKIYLFDDEKAVITSANLTNGGLINNFEYGIFLDKLKDVAIIISDFNALCNDDKTGIINQSSIDEARKILKHIPEKEKIKLPKVSLGIEKDNDVLQITAKPIIKSLSGWKRAVFRCVNEIDSQTFSLNEINKYENRPKKIYPRNNYVLDKIRQQLQQLRDIPESVKLVRVKAVRWLGSR